MRGYEFAVSLCGGWCNGTLRFEGENEDAAYKKAEYYIKNQLTKAFPTLVIDYYIECDALDKQEDDRYEEETMIFVADVIDEDTNEQTFWYIVDRSKELALERFKEYADWTWYRYAYHFYEASEEDIEDFYETHTNVKPGVYDR